MLPPPSTTYQRLRQYIAERMRMSPTDQPLMLLELLGRCSPAPAHDVARRILGEDVTQIRDLSGVRVWHGERERQPARTSATPSLS
jgi:hypothetical protein